ncbi:MAG: histidine phosphatase family protein, partial [Chloroflexi bacterium]|nr:histidine phosphatase family protein [Chloroflexota bacterium]
MRTLLIMRHGKSSWKDAELPDIERPLKKRGRKDVVHMGKLLDGKKLKPDLILCSTAKRARQTAEIVVEEIGFEGKVEYLDSLYMAELDTLIKTLQSLPDVKRVMIIGHNPGLETLAQLLTDKITSLPTAAVARIKIP